MKLKDFLTPTVASNLCTAVGGDQNKEFNASFLREKGPRGGIRIYCYCIFHIDQKAKIICIRSNLIYSLVFCWTVISLKNFSPFPSTSVGSLGLFTFLPQCTVHNLRTSELGVPVCSSLVSPTQIIILKHKKCDVCLVFAEDRPDKTDTETNLINQCIKGKLMSELENCLI